MLVAHNHFGIDLAPGLSIKLNAAFVSDVMGIDGVEGNSLKVVRQEFGGQVSTHVRCDISSGAVINLRPGAFKPIEGAAANGVIVDKSAEVGALTAGRRYLETVAAEVGDVDITKEPVLVSIGRGIQEKDNVAIAEELAEAMGAVVSCSRPVVDAKWLPKSRQVGSSGQTVQAQGLPGLRHERVVPAPGRTEGQSVHRRHQQESQGPHFPGGRRRHRRRHPGVPTRIDRTRFAKLKARLPPDKTRFAK